MCPKYYAHLSSGGGSVGRAVVSDTRDLPIVHLNRKDKYKEKEAGNGPPLKKQHAQLTNKFCKGEELFIIIMKHFSQILKQSLS